MRQGSTEMNYRNRYRLTEEEEELLLSLRENKKLLEKECQESGIDINDVKHYWYKSKLFSIFAKPKEKTLEHLKQELIDGMSKYSPKYPVIKRKIIKNPHCLVIDPADVHIGKLASEYETRDKYNMNIAFERVMEGINGILDYVCFYKLDKIALIIGNDILHIDTPRRTTTSGTPQDTDGMWYENFLFAKELYIRVIEYLMQIADVHVVHNVSNHDYMTGWYLSQVVSTWFKNSKNVSFENDMRHRKAFTYGNNFIGSTHGDGAKNHDLPLLMAQEFPDMWASTKYRYTYTHHVHHKTSKDHIGMVIESSRSVSGTDSWHHRNGYQHAIKAVEAYLHHPERGQIARFTYTF